MEAIAKYDFKATADDELSFKRGDILKVSVGARQCRAGLSLCSPTFSALMTHKEAFSHCPLSRRPPCAV